MVIAPNAAKLAVIYASSYIAVPNSMMCKKPCAARAYSRPFKKVSLRIIPLPPNQQFLFGMGLGWMPPPLRVKEVGLSEREKTSMTPNPMLIGN